MRILTALFLLVSFVLPAQADQASELRELDTFDANKAWQGVGRINIGRGGFCTGALIAPDLVLTAAHCFFDAYSGARVADEKIEFLAGWRNGRASAYRTARRTAIHPEYVYTGRENIERVSTDLAIIQLDQPIRNVSIKPFETSDRVGRGQEITVVSYAKDRADAPSLQETCHILGGEPGVYVTSCDVDFGASGAPVFVVENGKPRIMSVVSAKAEWNEQKVALTAGVGDQLSGIISQFRRSNGLFSRNSNGAKRITNGAGAKTSGGGARTSGALFIKP